MKFNDISKTISARNLKHKKKTANHWRFKSSKDLNSHNVNTFHYIFHPRGYALCKRFYGLVFESQDIFSYVSKIAFTIQWTKWHKNEVFSKACIYNIYI